MAVNTRYPKHSQWVSRKEQLNSIKDNLVSKTSPILIDTVYTSPINPDDTSLPWQLGSKAYPWRNLYISNCDAISNTSDRSEVLDVYTMLSNAATQAELDKVKQDLYDETKGIYATKTYVNTTIDARMTSVYKFKGSCTAVELEAKSGQKVGYVWNVTDEIVSPTGTYPPGTNWACVDEDEEKSFFERWDPLAGITDLSNYYTKDEVYNKDETYTRTIIDAKTEYSATLDNYAFTEENWTGDASTGYYLTTTRNGVPGNVFKLDTSTGKYVVVTDEIDVLSSGSAVILHSTEKFIGKVSLLVKDTAAAAQTLAGYGITDAYTNTETDALINNLDATKADKAITLAGYGITDAKIEDGVITLGTATITPLTEHQSLDGKVDKTTQVNGHALNSDVTVTYGDVGAAASSHTHTKSEITDFPESMPASDVAAWAKSPNKPVYSWGEITSKPETFTPSSHTHTVSNITDFPGSMPASDVYEWAKAASKPTYTYSEVGAAASIHTHVKADITDFPTSMPASDVYEWAKAASKPTYTYSEVGAAASSHTHTYSDCNVSITTTDPEAGSTLETGKIVLVYEE